MSVHCYTIPVIPSSLREVEFQYQVFDALDNLNKIVEDVFGRITTRVTEEKAKVDSIDSRIATAAAKVQHLRTTHGLTVFSANKYPAPEKLADYVPLYHDKDYSKIRHSRYHLSEEPHRLIEEKIVDPLLEDPFLPESKKVKKEGFDIREGLGRLPHNIWSIDSLLLFNSDENPYKKYVTLDNLAGILQETKEEEEKSELDLIAAPESLTNAELPEVSKIEYEFRPDLGNVPEFNLPEVLPELSMVADNINWGVDNQSNFLTIAPSTQSHLDDLPDVNSLSKNPKKSASASAPSKSTSSSSSSSSSSSGGPPPPISGGPPPPISGGPPPPISGGPPPPMGGGPPPPDSGPPPPVGGPPPPAPGNVPTAVAAPSSGRQNLLADIRKGKNLKKVGERKERKKAIAEAPPSVSGNANAPPAPTGSLFGDLLVALTRRQASLRGETTPTRSSNVRKTNNRNQEGDETIAMPDPNAEVEPGEWSEED